MQMWAFWVERQSEYCPYGISFEQPDIAMTGIQPISQGETHQQWLTAVADKGLHLLKGETGTFGLD